MPGSVTTPEAVFLAVGALGGVILALSVVLGGVLDLFDVPVDVDMDGLDGSSDSVGVFSTSSVGAGLLGVGFFGWASLSWGFPTWGAVVVAAAGGAGLLFGVARLFAELRSREANSLHAMKGLYSSRVTVTVLIPADGTTLGEVSYREKGSGIHYVAAVSDDRVTHRVGDRVIVRKVGVDRVGVIAFERAG